MSGGWYSSSNTDMPTMSGYFRGAVYRPGYLDMAVSGTISHSDGSALTPWTGGWAYFTESSVDNSHGIPVGSQSIFTASWGFTGSKVYGEWTRSHYGKSGDYDSIERYTASYIMGVNDSGNFAIEESTAYKGASNKTFYFASSSGKMGIGTKTPTNDVDIKADTIKFRNTDGSEETEFRAGKMIAKKFANREEHAEIVTETSGSELVMSYTPGTFDVPTTASAGDILGTITWEDESIGRAGAREDATAMRIRGVVNAVAGDGSAIKGSMNFGIGSSTAGQPIEDYFILGLGFANFTQSHLQMDGNLTIGNIADDDTDRWINWLSKDEEARWLTGIDVSTDSFVIDQNNLNAIQATSDFSLAQGGSLTLLGSLTCTQINTGNGATEIYDMNQDLRTDDNVTFNKVTTANMPGFTGSAIKVDGGSF
jgi:hypothetical protein